MSAPILKQVEERIAALDKKYGRPNRPLTPHSPTPRDVLRQRDVFGQLHLRTPVDAWRNFSENKSCASLLVWHTSKVVDALIFQGIPGIRDALVDLAANALVLAECIEAGSKPHSKSGGH